MNERKRRAFIGASTAGIGRAIAESLSANGVDVIINGRNESKNLAVASSISALTGNRVEVWTGDVTSPESVSELSNSIGEIDILIANTPGPTPNFNGFDRRQALLDAFERNMISVALLIDALLPSMERNKFGRIITILSTSAVRPIHGLEASSAARSGLIAALKSQARECAPKNITINHVLPGPIETERTAAFIKESESNESSSFQIDLSDSKLAKSIPAKRLGKPSEVAALCAFLSSELAGFITAQEIRVDGGLTI